MGPPVTVCPYDQRNTMATLRPPIQGLQVHQYNQVHQWDLFIGAIKLYISAICVHLGDVSNCSTDVLQPISLITNNWIELQKLQAIHSGGAIQKKKESFLKHIQEGSSMRIQHPEGSFRKIVRKIFFGRISSGLVCTLCINCEFRRLREIEHPKFGFQRSISLSMRCRANVTACCWAISSCLTISSCSAISSCLAISRLTLLIEHFVLILLFQARSW